MRQLRTTRLDIVPLSREQAEAILDGRVPAGIDYAEGYPADGTLVAAAMIAAGYEPTWPWQMFQAVHEGRVVAGVGFFDEPSEDGRVRIGYSETDEARREGYAAEGLRALLELAKAHAPEVTVTADVAFTNRRGVEVLEEAGMRQVGVTGDLFLFEA